VAEATGSLLRSKNQEASHKTQDSGHFFPRKAHRRIGTSAAPWSAVVGRRHREGGWSGTRPCSFWADRLCEGGRGIEARRTQRVQRPLVSRFAFHVSRFAPPLCIMQIHPLLPATGGECDRTERHKAKNPAVRRDGQITTGKRQYEIHPSMMTQ